MIPKDTNIILCSLTAFQHHWHEQNLETTLISITFDKLFYRDWRLGQFIYLCRMDYGKK